MCSAKRNDRLPPKADMCGATRHVRFVPKADIRVSVPPNLRSKTIHSGDNSNGDPGGDEAVFNAKATRGRRPSHSVLCC